MSWSQSSPLAVVRDGMWGLLMLAGAAWLAIGWSVLRLEPSELAGVTGAAILFGALTEVLRACAGARTWWLNATMAVLFLITGIVLLSQQDSTYTTPAAMAGWYLMVRGAVDVAVAMMTRDTDRIWGLLMVVGVLEVGLGFFAASPFARTAEVVVSVVGGLAVLRAVADLVTGLRLREVRAARADGLELPPERAAGVAGYSAGLSDYEAAPPRSRPRHRAAPKPSASSWTGVDGGTMWPSGRPTAEPGAAGGTAADVVSGGVTASGGMAAAGYVAADSGATRPTDTFHEEVLRTTADLDAMLALAGVTGAGVGAHLNDDYDMPEVPDTPEGAEEPDSAPPPIDAQLAEEAERAAAAEAAERAAAAAAATAAAAPDSGLPILDPTARAAQGATSGMDDTAIIAGGRRID